MAVADENTPHQPGVSLTAKSVDAKTQDQLAAAHPLSQRMPRIDSLTGLRWWAAFFVFTYHMHVFAPLPASITNFLALGFHGVTFFFVLSGFVLTWSASSKVSQSTFYWRRFARIYPSHFVALLLAIPVFYSFDPDPAQSWIKPVSILALALSFVLLQGWSNDPSILFSGNPAAWTLTCEAFFYALHPFINRILSPLRTRGALIFVIATVIVSFAYRSLTVTMPGVLPPLPQPLLHLYEFVLGMGLAWALRCGWRPRLPAMVGIGGLVACITGIVLVTHFLPGASITTVIQQFSGELVTLACALAVLAFAVSSLAGRKSIFASRVMVRLGEWSYAFYLVHATIIYIALNWLGHRPASWHNLIWFVGLLAIGVLAAAALHHGVERPFEKRIRAWKDKRASRRSQTASPDPVGNDPTSTSTSPNVSV